MAQQRVLVAPWTAEAPPPPAALWVDPYEPAIVEARSVAAPGGRRALDAARALIDEDFVVIGSCWDWAQAVFERAGGETEQVHRARPRGPFADRAPVRPRDGLYLVGDGGGGAHTASDLGWVDEPARVGLTVSYVGGRREETGRYSTYDLPRVYRVVRLRD
jgi:hypothetical protein